MLLAGAGRFGSFVETLHLPADADVEGLEASYERGVVRVVVPRRRCRLQQPQHQRPSPHYHHQAMGGGGLGFPYGGWGGRPAPAGFWGDQDLWW